MYPIIRSLLFKTDPETAHNRVANMLHVLGKTPILPQLIETIFKMESPVLEQNLFGLRFKNPIGLAAGMDKTGEALLGWQCFGFGFLEVGGFTYFPQPGNPQPRMLRILEDAALINRMGFNNLGVAASARILDKVKLKLGVPLFINIGKGKDTALDDAPKEYAAILEYLWPFGDAFVLNVSSPNTLGLRELQQKQYLTRLIQTVQERAARCPLPPGLSPKPILIKISPDLTEKELDEVLSVAKESVNGIIATNTTVSRERLTSKSSLTAETGGLSGRPLFPKSLKVVKYIHQQLPTVPLIASGGIEDFSTAWQMILAGARLVQMYTALVYKGPAIVSRINKELTDQLNTLHSDMARI